MNMGEKKITVLDYMREVGCKFDWVNMDLFINYHPFGNETDIILSDCVEINAGFAGACKKLQEMAVMKCNIDSCHADSKYIHKAGTDEIIKILKVTMEIEKPWDKTVILD